MVKCPSYYMVVWRPPSLNQSHPNFAVPKSLIGQCHNNIVTLGRYPQFLSFIFSYFHLRKKLILVPCELLPQGQRWHSYTTPILKNSTPLQVEVGMGRLTDSYWYTNTRRRDTSASFWKEIEIHQLLHTFIVTIR